MDEKIYYGEQVFPDGEKFLGGIKNEIISLDEYRIRNRL